MAQSQAAKLKALQQAFITADKDGDSLLKEDEFKEFVEIGYQKKDPTIGIDWKTAREVWVQAQGKSKSPSPPKQSQQNGKAQSNLSNQIKQAFIQCDKDADGFLNKAEFHEFVKVGFKKPSVPNGMYEQVCTHFKKDPAKGIDWLSCFALWKQSNPSAAKTNGATASVESGSPKKNKTPPPKKPASNNQSRAPNLRRVQTTANINVNTKQNSSSNNGNNKLSSLGRPGQLSPSQSTGNVMTRHRSQESLSGSGSQLTERNLRALDNKNGYRMNRGDDEVSVESDRSYRSSRDNRRHQRAQSRGGRGGGHASFDDGPDASQMVVQMMESKVKNLQNQLKLERMKRKKTDELAQSLLTQNEEYKRQIQDLQSTSTKSRKENQSFKDQLRKFKTQVDDDRQTIKHLQTQYKSMKAERDECYELLTKIEKEHKLKIQKEKAKHKAEIERLSTGFLQSLGAEPGKDVSSVVKELRQTNADLKEKVETLAATLERKNASLLEALQAVDTITNEEEKANELIASQSMVNLSNGGNTSSGNGKMRERLRSLNQRRKSFGLKNMNASNNSGSIEVNGGLTGLPRPPKRRNSQVGLNGNMAGAHHRPTATFFKKIGDVGDVNASPLNADKVKNGKEAQFVAQRLTQENAQKTDNIHNLETVNINLMAKLKTMEQQMQQLQSASNNNNDSNNNNNNNKHSKNESNGTITDLP